MTTKVNWPDLVVGNIRVKDLELGLYDYRVYCTMFLLLWRTFWFTGPNVVVVVREVEAGPVNLVLEELKKKLYQYDYKVNWPVTDFGGAAEPAKTAGGQRQAAAEVSGSKGPPLLTGPYGPVDSGSRGPYGPVDSGPFGSRELDYNL
eukprot:g66125.t1